nr:hypothetical protein [uncultured Lichenicoccus sp.]
MIPLSRRTSSFAALGIGAVSIGRNADAASPTSASTRLNRAGPESRLIAQRVGHWDVQETVWPAPGAAPIVTTGLVAERTMMGSLLQELLRPRADVTAASVQRLDMLSFNRLEGRWDYVSFDSRDPVGLMPASSIEPGDGRTIDLVFAPFAVPVSGTEAIGQLLRMRQSIIFETPVTEVKNQYFALADGTSRTWLAHRYACTQRS